LEENGKDTIVGTHEMVSAREVGTRVLFMDEGLIAEEGPPHKFFESPEKPRTREFLKKVL